MRELQFPADTERVANPVNTRQTDPAQIKPTHEGDFPVRIMIDLRSVDVHRTGVSRIEGSNSRLFIGYWVSGIHHNECASTNLQFRSLRSPDVGEMISSGRGDKSHSPPRTYLGIDTFIASGWSPRGGGPVYIIIERLELITGFSKANTIIHYGFEIDF